MKEVVFVTFTWPVELICAICDAVIGWRTAQWVKAVEVFAIAVGLTAIMVEINDRQEERLARMWTLATDSSRTGNSGKTPALEFLNKLGKPLSGISIANAYLVRIEVPEVEFNGANLNGANLQNANLRSANLSGANLNRAYLRSANLSGADLRNANLSDAKLDGANLSGANLWSANLSGVRLFLANLSGADLPYANLSGANLSGARHLTQPMLDKACIEEGEPPVNLPAGLKPPTNTCPKKEP